MGKSVTISAGISVILLVGLVSTGHSQSACKSVDATIMSSRALDSIRDASPEALAAFRALNLNPPRGRIVGGQLTLISDNPWQIALIRATVAEPTRSQFCGGSVIRDNWVLTAAHCVRNAVVREDPSRVDIIAGTTQYAIGGERLKVAAIHTHPNYNQQTMDNDFALLRLQSPVTKGKTIQFAAAATQIPDGANLCVTGWGATSEGGPGSIDLQGAQVPVVSNAVCNQKESYGGEVLPSMLCAGLRDGGVDSCQGDSGGPASLTTASGSLLVGVVSWGEGCARRLKYGIYSRIPSAADWIAKTVAGN